MDSSPTPLRQIVPTMKGLQDNLFGLEWNRGDQGLCVDIPLPLRYVHLEQYIGITSCINSSTSASHRVPGNMF
jgi:hypothetical protein